MTLPLTVLYRFYRPLLRLRHWVILRFTRPGLCVLGGFMVAVVLSPDTENNVAYQAFTVLLVLLGAAICFSRLFRAPLSATRLLPRFGTVGCPLAYTFVLRNLTPKTQRGLVLLEDIADPRLAFSNWLELQWPEEKRVRSFRLSLRRANPFRVATVKHVAVPATAPAQQVEVSGELTPWRRGVLRLAGLTLGRPDPLGLVRALSSVAAPQNVLILPKRYPLPPIALPGMMKYQPGGVALAANVGQSDEFMALRDYRHGDPLRHIHWRSWARVGKPVVKEFEDEFFVRHALVLDTFTGSPQSEAFEEAVSVAASFACAIQTQESLLDLLFVGPQSYCFTAGRGLAQADQMLEILASVRACREESFQALERLVLDHITVVSGCICVLLAWDEPRRSLVKKLQALGIPVLVLLVVEQGSPKTLNPGPMQDEPENFHILECGRIEEGLEKLA